MEQHNLSYRDENDRCYGATGMAVAVVIFDGEDLLATVDLDNTPDRLLEFTSDFYFSGNPGLSAKTAWNQILRNFNLTMGCAIANVLCRRIVADKQSVSDDVRQQLLQLMVDQGRDDCQLEADETTQLFNKDYAYLSRVFSHSGVQSIAHSFASTLARRRRLSRLDVVELLRSLQML